MITVLAWPAGSPGDLNPYVRLMYQCFVPPLARVVAFRPLMLRVPPADVFHFQWPEGIFEGWAGANPIGAAAKALRILIVARRMRRQGGAVVMTAHNLVPHEALSGWRRQLYKRYFDRLLSSTDLIVALTTEALALFRTTYPHAADVPAAIVPHPHYRTVYPRPLPQPEARRAQGLDAASRVIGLIGSLRPSKRVAAAIELFRRTARSDETLLVVGECLDQHYWTQITDAAASDPQIVLRRGRLNDADLVNALSATDVVLIHQWSTLNSGTALLALSMNRPVVAPAVGSMPELAATVGDDWMRLVPPNAGDEAYRAAFDHLEAQTERSCEALGSFAPDRLSRRLLDIFTEALRSAHDRRQQRLAPLSVESGP